MWAQARPSSFFHGPLRAQRYVSHGHEQVARATWFEPGTVVTVAVYRPVSPRTSPVTELSATAITRTPPDWRIRFAFSRTSTQADSCLRVIVTGVSVSDDRRWPPWLHETVASG